MSKDELIELIMKDIESQKDVINEIEINDNDNQVLIEINHDINCNLYVKYSPSGIRYVYDDHKKINHVPIDEMIMKLEQGLNHLKSIKDKAELVSIERNEERELYFIDTIDNSLTYEISVKDKKHSLL